MAYVKWIGAFLGGLSGGGVLATLAGYAIGAVIDSIIEGDNNKNTSFSSNYTAADGAYDDAAKQAEGARNGFLFSLMVLSAHIIQADGKIMHSEMEMVRRFLRQSFGEAAAEQGNSILLRLFEYRKQNGDAAWNNQIQQACIEMRMVMPEEHRFQLISFLVEIIMADNHIDAREVSALKELAYNLGFNNADAMVDQIFSLSGNSVEDAYKVFGLTPDATDDEVRKAYRKLALQYHPDRVATLGDDVKEAAKQKFQELNDAKDRIWAARGMK